MQIKIDEHVMASVEFMQREIPANKLIGVAKGLAELAPILWRDIQQEPIKIIGLTAESISEIQS